MTIIKYRYYRKSDNSWQYRAKSYRFVQEAYAFCLCLKKNKNAYVTGWACDDPYDNEWLWQHISLTEINRKEN